MPAGRAIRRGIGTGTEESDSFLAGYDAERRTCERFARRKEAALGDLDVNAEDLCKSRDVILRDIAIANSQWLLSSFMKGVSACRIGLNRCTAARGSVDSKSFMAGHDAEQNLADCYKSGVAARKTGLTREDRIEWKCGKSCGEIEMFERGYDDQVRRERAGKCMPSPDGAQNEWSPMPAGEAEMTVRRIKWTYNEAGPVKTTKKHRTIVAWRAVTAGDPPDPSSEVRITVSACPFGTITVDRTRRWTEALAKGESSYLLHVINDLVASHYPEDEKFKVEITGHSSNWLDMA